MKAAESKAAFYDREYNARLGIPDYPAIVKRWQQRSALARAQAPNLGRDLRYGPHPEETLDLFRAPRSNSPLFVFIHGGYWRAVHKDDFSYVGPPLVAAGVSVAVINYALVPSVDMETLVRQNLRALVWLWDHADMLGFDRNRIVVGGHSAGGHLTGMMAASLWPKLRPDLPQDLVKAGVSISGLFDLRPIKQTPFLNTDLKLTNKRAIRLSPALMTPRHRMPLVCAVGELESSEFHRQSRLMTEVRPGQDARYASLDGCHHMNAVDTLADPNHPLFATTVRLCLRGGSARVS